MRFSLNVERVKHPRRNEEDSLQESLVQYLHATLTSDTFFFSVPNGGTRHPREMENLKKRGLTPGVPDLVFCHKGRAFGLELKSQSGRQSDSQNTVFPKLRTAGMRIEVARTFNEAINHIKDMGIPLRANENIGRDVRAIFAEAARARR